MGKMETKYELYRKEGGFWRIRALRSFGSVRKGDLGGFVRYEYNLSQSGNCWVGGNAKVFEDARIDDNALVSGNARVYGKAHIHGNAKVYDGAVVCGQAWVYGDAKIYGNAQIGDRARVYGTAKVFGSAKVCGLTELSAGDFGKGSHDKDPKTTRNSSCGAPQIASRNAVVANALASIAGNREPVVAGNAAAVGLDGSEKVKVVAETDTLFGHRREEKVMTVDELRRNAVKAGRDLSKPLLDLGAGREVNPLVNLPCEVWITRA